MADDLSPISAVLNAYDRAVAMRERGFNDAKRYRYVGQQG
jgi:hypothetical protein